MTEWKPTGEPRLLGPDGHHLVAIQHLRGPGATGAHEVEFSTGETLMVLPDYQTTTRGRSEAVSVALGEDHTQLAAVIGELVLLGATNLVLNGRPLFPERGGRWIVVLAEDGEVTMKYVEGKEA